MRRAVLAADLRHELVLPGGETEDRLAAAAPGGAPGDALALEQHDLVAALGEVQRGRAAGDAAADHAHVRRGFALRAHPRSGAGFAEAA